MSNFESEFAHHEDGLSTEGSDEKARLTPNRRDRVKSKRYIPTEEVPSQELNPLDRLVAKEEGTLEEERPVSNAELLEKDADPGMMYGVGDERDGDEHEGVEGLDLEGKDEVEPLRGGEGKKSDEKTILHSGSNRERVDDTLGSQSKASSRNRGRKPRVRNISRDSVRKKDNTLFVDR